MHGDVKLRPLMVATGDLCCS